MELPEQWMGVTSLEVYNTVYNITEKNNKFEMIFTKQQLKKFGVDTELVPKMKKLFETSGDLEKLFKKLLIIIVK